MKTFRSRTIHPKNRDGSSVACVACDYLDSIFDSRQLFYATVFMTEALGGLEAVKRAMCPSCRSQYIPDLMRAILAYEANHSTENFTPEQAAKAAADT